jgi:hypothetical protein
MSHFTIPEPLAGDPETLDVFAVKYRKISAALQSAAEELAKLANVDITVSLAVDKVREKASDAYVDTVKVSKRYGAAAATFSTYASQLRDAQEAANRARATIAGFKSSADHAQSARDAIANHAMFILPSQQTADELNQANAALGPFQSEYSVAMSKYNQAVADKASAVVDAMNQLEDASNVSGLKDEWYQALAAAGRDIVDWTVKNIVPILKTIKAIAKVISAILDALAFVLVFINPLAALAIMAISFALSALVLICSIELYKRGRGSAADVITDGVGFALGALGLLTFNPAGKEIAKVVSRVVVKDLVDDGAQKVVVNLLGTEADYSVAGSVTAAAPNSDVTSGPWAPMNPEGQKEKDVPTDLGKDFVGAIPGADIVFSIDDAWKDIPAAWATGS